MRRLRRPISVTYTAERSGETARPLFVNDSPKFANRFTSRPVAVERSSTLEPVVTYTKLGGSAASARDRIRLLPSQIPVANGWRLDAV